MRVRLLIDIEVPEDGIAHLAKLIEDQPTVGIKITGDNDQTRTGRFMGAQPVQSGEEI